VIWDAFANFSCARQQEDIMKGELNHVVDTVCGGFVPSWVQSPDSGRKVGLLAVCSLGCDVDTVVDTVYQLIPEPKVASSRINGFDHGLSSQLAPRHRKGTYLVKPQPKDLYFWVLLGHPGSLGDDFLTKVPIYQHCHHPGKTYL
jgi:hypothetical protein